MLASLECSTHIAMQTDRRSEAFEMWIWRRMEISWLDKVTNEEVLRRVRRVNEDRQIQFGKGNIDRSMCHV